MEPNLNNEINEYARLRVIHGQMIPKVNNTMRKIAEVNETLDTVKPKLIKGIQRENSTNRELEMLQSLFVKFIEAKQFIQKYTWDYYNADFPFENLEYPAKFHLEQLQQRMDEQMKFVDSSILRAANLDPFVRVLDGTEDLESDTSEDELDTFAEQEVFSEDENIFAVSEL